MLDQGLSISEIGRRFNAMGIQTARGGKFFPEQISLIVRRLARK
jgi:hypothetical protein